METETSHEFCLFKEAGFLQDLDVVIRVDVQGSNLVRGDLPSRDIPALCVHGDDVL